MSRRALLLDVGNTRLKWGVLNEQKLTRTGSIAHKTLQEAGLSPLASKLPRDVDEVLACNVKGATFGVRLSSFVGIHCGCEIHFARSEKAGFGITNGYRHPRRLGVDRWVAMIGARAEFNGGLCVVDIGTACTIDVLDGRGRHLGGQILPGLVLMGQTLEEDTSDIGTAAKRLRDPGPGLQMLADDTRGAVQKGAVTAICGAIERVVRMLRAQGQRPKIVLTGGDASRILKQLDGNAVHRPHLVLQGLASMLQRL